MNRVFAKTQLQLAAGATCLMLLSLAVGLLQATTAHADPADSVTVSPNYNNMTALREIANNKYIDDPNASPNKVQTIAHVLKNERSSTILALKTAAYYSQPVGNLDFAITHIGDPDRCDIYDNDNDFNSKSFINVSYSYVTVDNVTHTVTYGIDKRDVCKTNKTGANQYNTNPGYSRSNRLFTNYRIPSNFANARRDVDTGMYKVNIVVTYADGVPKGNNTNQQQVSFRLRLDGCNMNDMTCLRFLSTVPANDSANDGDATDRNYSTLRGDLNDGGFVTAQRFSFGLPCSVNRVMTKTVSVYDVDNGAFFTSSGFRAGFFAQKFDKASNAWVTLSYRANNTGEMRNITNGQWVSDRNFNDGLTPSYGVQPYDASDRSTSVSIVMQPHTRYRLVLRPVRTTNLIGVGLPTETIFGDLDCNVTLNGSIDANPATDPIEIGREINMSSESTRNGNLALTSQYRFTFTTWYDTGNGVYNPGETLACPVADDIKSQVGDGTIPLASCNKILSDPAKSGGNASAICSHLIIRPTETISTVGSGRAPEGLTKCIQIGKRPHLAVLNGDVFAGGTAGAVPCRITNAATVSGSRIQIDNNNYGSYATYGVTSLGVARAFGSNNLIAGDDRDVIPRALVFSNRKTNTNVYGYFYNTNANDTGLPAAPRCLSDPLTTIGNKADTNGGSTATVDISTLLVPPNLVANQYYSTSGTLTLTASQPIPPGARVIIRADNATIKIASNITYAEGPYASTDEIPQVALLSRRNIVIDDAVTRIDSILAARGDVTTCDTEPRLNVCDKPLEINGVIVAGGLVRPYRTAGAQLPDYGQVAETVRLRPDAWLSQLPSPTNSSVYMRTVYEREVPPRF